MVNLNINSIIARRNRGNIWNKLTCVQQAIIFDKAELLPDGHWGFWDKKGMRKEIPLESNCLLGDGTATVQFPIALTSTAFTYFDGTTDQAGVTDGSAQWIIPNLAKVGNIRFETVSPFANWFLGDEADGFDLFNRVQGGDNASLINASAANRVKDNRFTSFQNEVGYSEGVGDQLIPAQVDSTGKLTGLDALGNTLQHKKAISHPVKIVDSNAYEFDGVDDRIDLDSTINLGKEFKIHGLLIFNDVTALNTITDYDTTSTIRFTSTSLTIVINGVTSVLTYSSPPSNATWYEYEIIKNQKDVSFSLTDYTNIPITGSATIADADNIDFRVSHLFATYISTWSFDGIIGSINIDANNERILEYWCADGDGDRSYDSSGKDNHGTKVNVNLATFNTVSNGIPYNLIYGFSQKLVCETSGATSIPFVADLSTQEYIWEFSFSKKDPNIGLIHFINTESDGSGNGYAIRYNNSEILGLYRIDAGVTNYLFFTGSAYISPDTLYRVTVIRSVLGEFSIYLNDILIIPSTGSNPVIDNTYTTSNYFVNGLASGDSVKNLSINGVYKDLLSTTDGTGTYSKVRVPAQSTTLDVEGNELSNPAGKWHNNAESKLLWFPCNNTTEIDATLSTPFLTSDGVTPIKKSYADFEAEGGNIYGEDQIIYNLDFLREIVCFEANAGIEQTDCWAKAADKIGKLVIITNETGEPLINETGKIIIK